MILTKKTIKKINELKPRLSIALALGFSEQWVVRLIDMNKENGPLTTVKALQVIREQTGFKDSEILEEQKIAAK